MARARPITDLYIAAVESAIASPGRWIEIPRHFRTEFNANLTAVCLRGGYLRVEVREGDTPEYVAGKRYLKTPARRKRKSGIHEALTVLPPLIEFHEQAVPPAYEARYEGQPLLEAPNATSGQPSDEDHQSLGSQHLSSGVGRSKPA